MGEVAIAIVSTGRDWQGRWARHLRDHGPANVVDVIAEPHTAFDHLWQLLVVDASSVMADREFVDAVHERGRGVLAVWDPTEPATKQRALDAGADELIECEATALEFAAKVLELAAVWPSPSGPARRARRAPVGPAPRRAGQLVAVGGPVGARPEQVAFGMATALAKRGETVVVMDVNEVCPSVAQLLGLLPLPNLASAVAASRTGSPLEDHLQPVEGDRWWVVAGLAEPYQWSEIGPRGVLSVVTAVAARAARTIAVVGPMAESLGHYGERFGTTRATLNEADAIVAVGVADPVGLTRLTTWVADVRAITRTTPLYLVAADAPRDRHRQREVLDRLAGLGSPAGVSLLPDDTARVARAAWNGRVVRRGPLVRSAAQLAAAVAPARKKAKR